MRQKKASLRSLRSLCQWDSVSLCLCGSVAKIVMPIKTLHITNAYHSASGGIKVFYRALLEAARAVDAARRARRAQRCRRFRELWSHLPRRGAASFSVRQTLSPVDAAHLSAALSRRIVADTARRKARPDRGLRQIFGPLAGGAAQARVDSRLAASAASRDELREDGRQRRSLSRAESRGKALGAVLHGLPVHSFLRLSHRQFGLHRRRIARRDAGSSRAPRLRPPDGRGC